LLHSLGVSQEALLRKQQEHLNTLTGATQEPRVVLRLLNSVGYFDVAEKLLLEGKEAVERSLSKIVNKEYGKMLNKRSEQNCGILIPKSRLLFGACDPRDVLRPGQCFVKVTHEDGVARAITGTWVIVARSPCLDPGNLQKLWAVAHPELDYLIDCVVFSTRGKRPAADLMSGGDLDGDTCKSRPPRLYAH
jgi:RNA dependent RNA polymerase